MPNRLDMLQALLADAPFDALVLVPGPNYYYATGADLHPSERLNLLFLPKLGEPVALAPGLEAPYITPLGLRTFQWRDEEGPRAALASLAELLAFVAPTLAIEYGTMRYFEAEALRDAFPGARLVDGDPFLSAARSRKDDAEIEAVRHAVRVTEAALEKTYGAIRVGMTESELARLLTANLLDAGADRVPFCHAAAGPRSAEAHAQASDRALEAGDVIILDCGATVNHYSGDITRVVALEPVPEEIERIHALCLEANAAGRAACHPGATGDEVDRATRAVIDEAGFGAYFFHRTGHGLGLEIHEPPYIVAGNREPLVEGNLFTIEPGIYLPGVGGVRIEDNIVITADGHDCLTTIPRELVRIG